jgi:hypothetical protein
MMSPLLEFVKKFFEKSVGNFGAFPEFSPLLSGENSGNPQPDKTRLVTIRKIRLSASYQHYVAVALIRVFEGGFAHCQQLKGS